MPNKNNAQFAFFYMLSLVALIFMSMATGMIIFQIINKNITDVINQYRGNFSSNALKFAISSLIISMPIYYLTTRQIFKNLYSGELDRDSGIRKWLTYLILFITSVVMIGWFIGTVNSFLDGELTLKFALKALTAIGIAAIIFNFYFYDIKRDKVKGEKNKIIQIYLYSSIFIIVATFVASLFIVESPRETRNRKLDEAILTDFETISNAMTDYYNEYDRLPEDLEILKEEFTYIMDNLQNSATKEKYGYKVIDDKKYELCATFRSSNKEAEEDEKTFYRFGDFWLHDAGYQCLSGKVRVGFDKMPPLRFVEPAPEVNPIPGEVVPVD